MNTEKFCNCCEKPLKEGRFVSLWYSGSTGRYYRTEAEVEKAGNNQGTYEFGTTCAKKILKRN